MRAPLSWLRDYAPLEADVADLANTLSSLGLVVEGVEHVGGGLGDIVVARVAAIRPLPGADRVRLVDVDVGAGDTVQIVCGAWNFIAGDLVPLAPVGAVLPGDFTITRKKFKGEWSDGMLCSPPELELPAPAGAADGLLILPPGLAPPGTPLIEALDLRPDVVFDLDISPNRPDALCMAGVARDLAAALGERWEPRYESSPVEIDRLIGEARIVVDAGDLCPRFTGTLLEGVPDGPSPAWIARRLTLAGMRPISAVVDVSNYVMLDLGQPNHAYDLDRLGGGGLLVRRGHPGESLVTLDGVTRTLQADDCVICDAAGVPVGVGGIMGGSQAEIGPETRRVLLEAAWFSPMAVARTGVRLGLHSEARVRFERGVDPEVAQVAVDRFLRLLSDISDGRLRRGPVVDARDEQFLPRPPLVEVRTDRVNAILGTTLTDSDVERMLTPIGFAVTPAGTGRQFVQVPSWRLESEREIDVIEEVARMWGYRRIARTVPSGARAPSGGLSGYQRDRRRVRDIMAGAGFDEAWTTTFLAPGDLQRAGLAGVAVEVENPLDQSESILRTSLLPGLLKAARFNVDRQAAVVCLFEIGNVFSPPAAGATTPEEVEELAAIIVPPPGGDGTASVEAATRLWQYMADALSLEEVGLRAASPAGWHPTRAAEISGPRGRLGAVGEVDPEVVAAYGLTGRIGFLSVSLPLLLAQPRRARSARDVSRFPASDLDLAFAVDEGVPAGAVLETLTDAGGEALESAHLFDVYRGAQVGEGRRSLAFRLRFRAPDRTLSDTELAAARQAAIEAVLASHGAELRA
jgi:phenylalanyl-tRNA synthetase beta chain